MRVLLQRVSSSSVVVNGETVGAIGKGFTLLVGITHSDTQAEADWLAKKIAGIRLFEDDAGKMNRALNDVDGAILAISQFTLYGDARKGRRPSFINAARPEQAEPLFDYFVEKLRGFGLQVETGRFGASMAVDIQNDGPVTLMLERDAT